MVLAEKYSAVSLKVPSSTGVPSDKMFESIKKEFHLFDIYL